MTPAEKSGDRWKDIGMSALVCLGDTWLDPDAVAAVTPAPGGTDIHIIGLPKIFIQGAYPAQIAGLLHPTP